MLLLAVLVAGCAHKQEEVVVLREVPVPTPVRCIDPAQIPPEPPRVAQRFNGNARHDLEILAGNATELRAWGEEMRTLLEQCVSEAPEPEAAPEP